MKRMLSTLGALALILGATAAANAIELKPFNCEKAVVVGLVKMAKARGACLTACITRKNAKPETNICRRNNGPFDSVTAACTDKAVTNYVNFVTNKCTGNMPPCGGYLQGFCSTNTSLSCNVDSECGGTCNAGFCSNNMGISCMNNAQCGGVCQGRCSTTTTTSCEDASDCPGGETCTQSATAKDVPTFAADNVGAAIGQIDSAQELLFQCRQKVCSTGGDLCGADEDCSVLGDTCAAGRCSDNAALCNYDGDCNPKKKCLPMGMCATAPTSCLTDTDCSGTGPCLRHGRCSGATKKICFADGDCPGGETCGRTTVDTNRIAESNCTKRVGAALGNLSFAIANCQSACALERDRLDGKRCDNDPLKKCKIDANCVAPGVCRPTSCDPFATGRCSVTKNQVCVGSTDCPAGETCEDTTPAPISGALLKCRTNAKNAAINSINKKCLTLPACGAYSPFGGLIGNFNTPQQLIGFVTGVQDGQFKEDNPDLSPGSNFCLP